MKKPNVIYKETEPIQIACIQETIEKRADVFQLLDQLRQFCKDVVCGPAMAIFHFGAVAKGFLIEAAFPVSQPVQTDTIYTRTLEAARAISLIHHGPRENIKESIQTGIEHISQHAMTTSGLLREIYLNIDAEHPEHDETEIQIILHDWDRRLANGLDQVFGVEVRQQVMKGIEGITPSSSKEVYNEWICEVMRRIDRLTDDPTQKYHAISGCAHVFPPERIQRLQVLYNQTGDIDAILREIYKDEFWYENPSRRGNVLTVCKNPYDPEGYNKATTAAEKRKAYCHCPFVKPYLDEIPSKLSPTFCNCGLGWYKPLWEGLIGQPVKIENVRSLLKGDEDCMIAITLPIEMEGEMSPDSAG